MPNGTYGGVRGRKTKVGGKLLLRFPPTRLRLLLLWKYLYPVVIRVVDKIKPHGCILKTDTIHFFVILLYGVIVAGYTKA